SVALADGGNFAFYYLLLHLWLRFDASDAYVRLMSVIPAVLSVPVMFALGRRLLGIRAGIIAAFLLAISPFYIAYAQEARGYSLLMFLSIVSTLFFVRCIDRSQSRLDLLAYCIASVLMIYTHWFGILVVAAHVSTLLALGRKQVPWRSFVFTYAVIMVTILPLAYFARHHGLGSLAWVPPMSGGAFFGFLQDLAGGWPLLVLYAALTAYATIDALRGPVADRDALKLPATLVLNWLLVPIVLAALFSALVAPIFVARFLIITLPALVLLVSYALVRIPNQKVAAAVGTLVVALSAQALWHYYFHQPKEDWRGVAGFIAAQGQPGDAVVTIPSWFRVPLLHAVERLPRHGQVPTPLDTANDPTYIALDQHPRVWVVLKSGGANSKSFHLSLAAQTAMLTNVLRTDKRLTTERRFVAIDVRLYAGNPRKALMSH
ncbi:MAG TPA: glycosyltransferase family 39 protein, partial [Candidatus Eremiobacteraceae bacterium]|nr:glycosyltransferase family 39 protein [Candidatus Eremiobacteraceae bacterium]